MFSRSVVQHKAAPQRIAIPASGTRILHPNGTEAGNALTIKPDQSDQAPQPPDDGSLTLYAGPNSPGADRESNWLPAPDGPFWLVLRNYGPDQSIIDGTYRVPPVMPVD